MGGSGGGGSQVVYVPVQTGSGSTAVATSSETVTTPAIAQSVGSDTMRAIENQSNVRHRARSIESTYNDTKLAGRRSGSATLGGS